jgi:outer membrane protein TolC
LKVIITIFVLVSLMSAGLIAEEPALKIKTITPRECIERALTGNLDLQIERISPMISDWGITREKAAFDPSVTGRVTYDDVTEPASPEREASTGVSSIQSEQLRLRAGLVGKLPTGTLYDLGFVDTRTEGTFSPSEVHNGNGILNVTQPLLRDFWLQPNTAQLRIATKNRAIAGHALVNQVISTVTAVQNAYFELVYAIENEKAKKEDLNRSRSLLADNRKRVEVGTMSPLDITLAEAGAAEREEAVIVAARAIVDRENDLKRLILPDVTEWRGLSLVPAEYPVVQMRELDFDRSMRAALAQRPDYRQAREEVEKRGILVAYQRNQLWPRLDLAGSFGLNARGENIGDWAGNLASGDARQWGVGIFVSIPIGNREARAKYHISQLEAEQALLRLKRAEQQILVELDNVIGQVQTNLKRLDATRASSRLAEESLRAEEAKFRAGASTSFLVLQAQSQLASARSAEIRAQADYNKSLVALDQAEGATLRQHNIVLDEQP